MALSLRRGESSFQRAADGSMTLMEHLRELRSRLLKATIGVLLGVIVGWILSDEALRLLSDPYCQHMAASAAKENAGQVPAGYKCPFVQLGVADVLLLRMKIALWLGLIFAAPVWLYQLWAFIAPGLHRHERRWAYAFTAVATPLFGAGAVLAFFVVAKGLAFLLQFSTDDIQTQLDITRYVEFVTGIMLLFGAAFEFPLLILMLNFAGIASAKRLLGWWRTAVFLFFLFAAVTTPTPDPFGMTALALCLSALYFAAVGVAFVNDRRRRRRHDAEFGNVGDDEISPLDLDRDDAEPLERVDAEPVEAPDPVETPEPVAPARAVERRYDDYT